MSGFRSVNTSSGPDPPSIDEIPTSSPIQNDARTPAPQRRSQPPPTQPPNPAVDDATTPTRSTFSATGMSAQRPLPSSPFPDYISKLPAVTTPERTSSQRSGKSRRASRDSGDMDMDDSEGENAGSPGDSGSGNEASTNKKKKTQRFYCTDFPPCNLSFTRSEHLARHIRKHTGERPFQCHCSRRFSRLDNLRQHAQTVHQNEEIPIDSPAAMGTRFQKQIRTDKMRQPPPARSRAATSSGVPPGRGHQKSLSTSIIPSNVAAILPSEGRRRPPAIVMPNDGREAYPQEARQGLFDGNRRGPPSEGGYHTPTSSTFSTGPNSPGWGSTGGRSPAPLHSRSHSMYSPYDDRVRARRLSQPSGSHPFPSSPSRQQWAQERNTPLSPYQQFSPYPGNGSLLPSPTTPTSNWSRRESISSVADDAYRRRTWHPDTRDFAGASRLSQVINTSQLGGAPVPPPLADRDHHGEEQGLRLPGIESFDPPQPPSNMVPRQPSPMMIDSVQETSRQQGRHMYDLREVSDQSDTGLDRGISRLNIDHQPRDSATAWAAEASQAVLAQADQVRASHAPQGVRFEAEPVANNNNQQPPRAFSRHQHTVSAPINSYRDMPVRMGRLWEASRAPVHTIQERRERPNMMHPNMDAFSGFPARNEPPVVHQQPRAPPSQNGYAEEARYQGAGPRDFRNGETNYQQAPRMEQPSRDDMRGLEALVAVATNERLQERDQPGARNTSKSIRGGFAVYEVDRQSHPVGLQEGDNAPRDSANQMNQQRRGWGS